MPVPISSFQARVLAVIAKARNPESFVAGGLPLNRSGPRLSDDVDIFHESEASAAASAETDAQLLSEAGFSVHWLRRRGGIYSAEISQGRETTKLEWVADSDYRFFPVTPDAQFGFVLHPVDLAVNKLLAATSRREVRDIVDLVGIHQRYLSLGAIAMAAAEVAPGFTPEGLLAELRRNSRHADEDFRALKAETEINPAAIMSDLKSAIDAGEAFVALMPSDTVGTIYLENGVPVQPDPKRLDQYVAHRPQRRGQWPTSSELTAAMLKRLQTLRS